MNARHPTGESFISASTVEVLSYGQATISEADESGIALVETDLTERFTGDLTGAGVARHLRVRRADGTDTFTCVERFTGTLDGRAGSFALTAEGYTDTGDVVHGRWEVVPGSGTGELRGLRGYAAFAAGHDGRTASGWGARDYLTYWFDPSR
jgi:hypothetical protein